jgi:hypothetical protein
MTNLLDLPNELLLEIFSYLNCETFKQLSVTSKRINELVENSNLMKSKVCVSVELPQTFLSKSAMLQDMEKLKVDEFFTIFNEISNRNYQNLRIRNLTIQALLFQPNTAENLIQLVKKFEFESIELHGVCDVTIVSSSDLTERLERITEGRERMVRSLNIQQED